jgi:hypothetical protein
MIDPGAARWRKSTRSADGSDCVELARETEIAALRDSISSSAWETRSPRRRAVTRRVPIAISDEETTPIGGSTLESGHGAVDQCRYCGIYVGVFVARAAGHSGSDGYANRR